jgi:hypothetical protein
MLIVFIPVKLMAFYGISLDANGIGMARYFGISNLFIGMIFWSYSSVSPAAKSWPKLLLYSRITPLLASPKEGFIFSISSPALIQVLAFEQLGVFPLCLRPGRLYVFSRFQLICKRVIKSSVIIKNSLNAHALMTGKTLIIIALK